MKPLRRRELIRKLRALNWTGPYERGKHAFMKRGEQRLAIPNEHGEDISVGLQMKILREATISRRDWEKA
jgi:predicted RNA binding protein YcfA (HicA-like mRNA interferase family)